MRLARWHLRSGTQLGAAERGLALAIGAFDGLHLGHQTLIARTVDIAQQRGLCAALLSFEPTPREYLLPADPPARLTNFRERWRCLEATGLESFCVLRFGRALQQHAGREFLALLRERGALYLVVGHDFRFGRGTDADAAWLAATAPSLGVLVQVEAPVMLEGERISSGAVRHALAAGDLKLAARLLGRPYTMRGRVRVGARLGRELGYPTANLALHRRRSALNGIFAVRVNGVGLARWPGVASLGTRPTVNGTAPLLEVHLFDFHGELYGRELEVEFVHKLRDEQRFDSVDLMVQQMHRDAAQARHLLSME